MLHYPASTTRAEKWEMIKIIKEQLLTVEGSNILAIGIYGSFAINVDGPFSDIEIHVIKEKESSLIGHEFIYPPFKIEISVKNRHDFIEQAKAIDDSWALKAGAFIHILPIYDPANLFEEVKIMPMQVSASQIKEVMKEFMIWEPYETIAKIRNNYFIHNHHYLPLGAKDFTLQTAKLIGLANKTYYRTRARMWEDSLLMKSKPTGYEELAHLVMHGFLSDAEIVYKKCELLWEGLNQWFQQMGIEYRDSQLPF